jgi:uracil phosphoribosyltransferase
MSELRSNPLVESWLGELRDPSCTLPRFRQLTAKLAAQLAVAVANDLAWDAIDAPTPLATTTSTRPSADATVLVPVLRAGLAMCPAMLDVLDFAAVALVGVARDEETLEASFYLEADAQVAGRRAVVCDPMLATGSSIVAVGEHLEACGAAAVSVCAILAAPEGLDRLAATHPDWRVHVVAVDDRLDEHGFIVPGLGDAGDRWSGLARPW